MDQINAFFESVTLFKKLGIDSTVIFQFIIFLVTFFVLKALFFSKLLFVIEQREGKTTKLESNANDKFADAEKLATRYNNEIQEASIQAQGVFSQRKADIVARERARFKEVEEKANEEFMAKRSEIESEFKTKKESVLKNADDLASELTNRLTT